MGILGNRVAVVGTYLIERIRHGALEVTAPIHRDVLFVLDGVGGFQFGPLLVRRVIRQEGYALTTVLYKWQFGLIGEVWTDLMWYRRNRVMGVRLARRILAFRRAYPESRIHILAYSGGAGIAAFACEALHPRSPIETMILACPALSPAYNLSRALHAVQRMYALVSHRDRYLLGIGTTLFGTMDRKFTCSGGMVGFRLPPELDSAGRLLYERLREIRWSPSLKSERHHGGHTGWLMMPLLRKHLMPLLQGRPELSTHPIGAGDGHAA